MTTKQAIIKASATLGEVAGLLDRLNYPITSKKCRDAIEELQNCDNSKDELAVRVVNLHPRVF